MSAIRRAVESSALSFDDIDYINAHGTGTAKNDEAEFLSLHTLLTATTTFCQLNKIYDRSLPRCGRLN